MSHDDDDELSRRVFVQHLTFMGGGVVLLGGACEKKVEPAPASPVAVASSRPAALVSSHQTFTDEEFAILTAAVDRIVPRDQDPGAVDAHVPDYIDAILQTPQLKQMKEQFVPGVPALNRRCERKFKVGFVQATPAQRDEILTDFKNSGERTGEGKFYEILIVLTMEGFLGDPSYGGNKDEVGWKLLGFTLVGRAKGDPGAKYNGTAHLHHLKCGNGKGC